MTIFNLGSINIDHIYKLAHLPRPGETILASEILSGLGGKGANQSVAAARAGARLYHIGAVGPDGGWILNRLQQDNINIDNIFQLDSPTGHAIISVDRQGENVIMLYGGTNYAISEWQIDQAFIKAEAGDWLLLQNETNAARYACKQAKALGLKIGYCAAPFDEDAIRSVIDYVDLLAVNEIEAQQIAQHMADINERLKDLAFLVTRGAEGAVYRAGGNEITAKAIKVKPVDTTGAGDTFLGYMMAALDSGQMVEDALNQAVAAASIQITRTGAAEAIPHRNEVTQFMKAHI